MEVHNIHYRVNKHNLRSERQRFRRGEPEVKICVRRRGEVGKSGCFPNKCANRVTRRVPGWIEGVKMRNKRG